MAIQGISSSPPVVNNYSVNFPSGGGLTDPTIQRRITENYNAYYGSFKRQTYSRPGMPDDYVPLDMCKLVVDKGVSFLFGENVEFEATDPDANEFLKLVWKASNKMTLLSDLGISGALCGIGVIKINVIPGEKIPTLSVIDPAWVNISVLPNDITKVVSYAIQYKAMDPDTNKYVTYRQEITRQSLTSWLITDMHQILGQQVWTTDSETVFPYPFPPILHCKNLPSPFEIWGQADLTPNMITLNEAINDLISNMRRTVRLHAHPKVWLKGVTGQNMPSVDLSPDKIIPLPANSELGQIEMTSEFQGAISVFEKLKQMFHESAHIPEFTTDSTKALGNLSGLAIKLLFAPLVERTELKRELYGGMLGEICRRVLCLGGYDDSETPEIHWQNVTPVDPMSDAQTALAWEQAGVSNTTAITRLGFDPAVEAENRRIEKLQDANSGAELLKQFNRGMGMDDMDEDQDSDVPMAD